MSMLALAFALLNGLSGAEAWGQGFLRGTQTIPSVAFDAALNALGNGEFSVALEIAGREYASGIRAAGQRWIDSIPAATVVGECLFELGRFREAVAAYDEALLLAAQHADWLLAVQFPTQAPQALPRGRLATWGRSARGTRPAAFPDTMPIRQAGADPQKVLAQGGVLAAPVNFPIRPQEIMRSLVISLYRRGVILGPLAGEGTAIDEVAGALGRRPAPPNHWSQSWVDIAQGTAAWSQGRIDQAVPLLERGLTIGNKLDHPLTPWGLLVLGRIALVRDDALGAARLFEEAGYAAAEFGDSRALEESFRMVLSAHMIAGTPGIPATVQGGAEWARGNLPLLRASLLASSAEVLAAAGNAQAAAARLAEIDGRLLHGDAGRGELGALVAYAAALSAYAAADPVTGDAEFERALSLTRARSPRLFQTAKLVEMVMAGTTTISDRQAEALFARLLGDPPGADFTADPLGTLAVVTTPRPEAFDAWGLVAARRGTDAALLAAEAAVRARWLGTLPAGGRRIGIERLLGADPARLSRDAAARRAALLGRHPDLSRLIDEDTRLRTPLTAALLAASGKRPAGEAPPETRPGAVPPGEPRDWESLAAVSHRRGTAIDLLAAGREPLSIDFPPLLPAADVRSRLSPGELILSFHWTAAGLWAALESADRVATWEVQQPAALAKEIGHLAKSLCLFDPHVPVTSDRILETDWRASAAAVERLIFERSKVSLTEGIGELAIVPDGLLWYLPFEILPAGGEGGEDDGGGDRPGATPPRMLRDVCRIRYAPTRSLAVTGANPPGAERPVGRGVVGVHAGRAVRGEKPEAAAEALHRLMAGIDRALPLPSQSQQAHGVVVWPSLPAALCDSLVVLDEVSGDGAAGVRGMLGRGAERAAKGGASPSDWLGSPHKRPQCVVVAGMQSAMASGLSRLPPRPGDDLFIAATDLLAAGARTVLVSRWRMGGKSTTDLVSEFLRDLDDPAVEPAASWYRSVEIVTAEEPDMAREGRLRPTVDAVLGDMRHPLFWAGYMLIDGGTSSLQGVEDGRRPALAPAKGGAAAAKGPAVRQRNAP